MKLHHIEILVGVFVLAGILSMGVLAIQVSGFNVDGRGGTYSVYASFENISGLVARAEVTIAGVIVGQVAEITLDGERHQARVRMEIREEVANIPVDTIAAVHTDGLLGRKYIALKVGGEDLYLQEGDEFTDVQSAVDLEDLIGQFLRR